MNASETAACVLVVDDEFDIREMLSDILVYEGYNVLAASNGEEALEQLRAGTRPCLILLDVMMPVMDGYEFRKRQSLDPGLSSIPVVVVSGDGRIEEKARALSAASYLRKPVDLEDLMTLLDRYCPRRPC